MFIVMGSGCIELIKVFVNRNFHGKAVEWQGPHWESKITAVSIMCIVTAQEDGKVVCQYFSGMLLFYLFGDCYINIMLSIQYIHIY